jgi:hypothetical protein
MAMVYGKTGPLDSPEMEERFRVAAEFKGSPLTKEEKALIRRHEKQVEACLAQDALDLVRAFQPTFQEIARIAMNPESDVQEIHLALTKAANIIAVLSRKIEFDHQIETALEVSKMPEILSS